MEKIKILLFLKTNLFDLQNLNKEIQNGTVINLSVNNVLSFKKAEYGEEVPPNLIDKTLM